MTASGRHSLLLLEELGLAPALVPLLAASGWTVHATTSVREAIYTAKQHPVEAMIVALRLPDERGDVAFYRIAAEYPPVRRQVLFLVNSQEDETLMTKQGYPLLRLPSAPEVIVRSLLELCGE